MTDSSKDQMPWAEYAPRVESCIAGVMKRFPGTTPAARLRYFEEVHQHLAPLARELEHALMLANANADSHAAAAAASRAAAWQQLSAMRKSNAGLQTNSSSKFSSDSDKGVPPDNLPRWIDDLKGKDPTTDALIEYIIAQSKT